MGMFEDAYDRFFGNDDIIIIRGESNQPFIGPMPYDPNRGKTTIGPAQLTPEQKKEAAKKKKAEDKVIKDAATKAKKEAAAIKREANAKVADEKRAVREAKAEQKHQNTLMKLQETAMRRDSQLYTGPEIITDKFVSLDKNGSGGYASSGGGSGIPKEIFINVSGTIVVSDKGSNLDQKAIEGIVNNAIINNLSRFRG